MALTNIVRTQISLRISAITRAGFGTMLFIYEGGVTETDDRVLQFGDADEVLAKYGDAAPATLAANAFFGGDIVSPLIKIGYKLSGETWTEALAACEAFDSNWYAFAIDSAAEADILLASAWAQPRAKLYMAKSADNLILDPADDTDIGSQLLALNYDRTALIYHSLSATAYPELAWAGGNLPQNPGSITWAFKRAPGIPADSFDSAELSALEAKRVSHVENVSGLTIVLGGYTSRPGFFIDVRRGLDYVAQRMNEDVFLLLATSPKVPGSDVGSAMVESTIRARLNQSVDDDIFIDDDNLTVSVPSFADRDPVDRADRLLTGCKFTANLAGAIHEVEINGEVTV